MRAMLSTGQEHGQVSAPWMAHAVSFDTLAEREATRILAEAEVTHVDDERISHHVPAAFQCELGQDCLASSLSALDSLPASEWAVALVVG